MLSGISPTYFVPYQVRNSSITTLILMSDQFQNHVSLSEKRDQVMDWIDLPIGERPRLLLGGIDFHYLTFPLMHSFFLVYDDSIDHAGHSYGPMSADVNVCLFLYISFIIIHPTPISEHSAKDGQLCPRSTRFS